MPGPNGAPEPEVVPSLPEARTPTVPSPPVVGTPTVPSPPRGGGLGRGGAPATSARDLGTETVPSPPRGGGLGRGGAPSASARDLGLTPRTGFARFVEEVLRFGRKGFARVIEFAPTRLNLSWITDQLAAGGAFRTADIPRLQRMGITGVVDCREEASDDEAALRAHGIEFLRLPTPDVHQITQEALDTGVAWVNERLDRGAKVYVHCLHGVGRGPLLGCCVLVARGKTAAEALTTMKTRRWQASPNEEQINALIEYASRHKAPA